jgi:MFS family permease
VPAGGLLAPLGAALRLPAFRLLWLSLLPGTLGMMMASVAFGYVAYQLSGSTATLAIVNAGWGLPMVLLSPAAGVVADRFPRRNVLLLTQGLVGLTAVAAWILIATGTIQVWHLFLVTLAQGTAFAFNIPARQALIAELVGPKELANALALYNAGLNFNRVAGPAIGGALLTLPAMGASGVFAVMSGLYLLVLVLLQRIPATRLPVRSELRTGTTRTRSALSTLGQMSVGLRYVAERPALRALMLLAFLPLLFAGPYQSLMPAVAARVFHVDAAGLGALLTANGLGALCGSLVLAALSGRLPLARLQSVAGLLLGGGLVAFALCGAFGPALGLIAVVGGASAVYTAVNNTLLIGTTPPEYHGRVMGVYMMTFATMPLAGLPTAWLADQIGLSPTLALCGILAALTVARLARRSPPAAPE